MNKPQGWCCALVVLLLLVAAACGGNTNDPQDAEGESEGPQVNAAPQTISVTISSDGAFTPDPIAPDPGDTVAFFASGDDVVLCVEPASIFGAERYAIANGDTLNVTVQPGAIHVDFAYAACLGDLDAACGGCRGGEGGGKTGP